MECGECTVCCILPALEVLNKRAGEKCINCNNGCTIYETRPEPCKEFRCIYHQNEVVNIALRPDKCGVMFELVADDLVVGTIDQTIETKHLMGQIRNFRKEGMNVVILDNGEPTVYQQEGIDPKDILDRVYNIARKVQWQ